MNTMAVKKRFITLIEMIIVITLIGIIMGALAWRYTGALEKGKAFKYSYSENYRDIKFLTSFYFNERLPAVEKTLEFNIPSWLEIDLREFNFAGTPIQKTSTKEGDITRVVYHYKDVAAYEREPHTPNHALSFPHVVTVSKTFTEGGKRNVLFENVKDLYGWYSSVCKDIGNKPEELKNIVGDLTREKKTDLEKIEWNTNAGRALHKL